MPLCVNLFPNLRACISSTHLASCQSIFLNSMYIVYFLTLEELLCFEFQITVFTGEQVVFKNLISATMQQYLA